MKLTQLISTLVIAGTILLAGNANAYINQNSSFDTPVTVDRLQDLYETNSLAEQIWSRLTAEFVAQFEAGNYTEAANTARTSYDLAEKSFGPNHINTADSLLKLGIISDTLGDHAKAKEYMLDALIILQDQLGPVHEDVAVVYTNLANLYFEQHDSKKSEEYHTKALKIRQQIFGNADPTVAQSLYNLAVLYDENTELEKAKGLYESALKIWYSSFGPNHPYVANALNNLANIYSSMNDFDHAVELHKQSLTIRRQIYGNNHAEVARSLINLGKLYVKNSDYDKAKPIYSEAIGVAEKLFGPTHPQVAMLLYSLANIYHIQGRMDSDTSNIKKMSTNQKGNVESQAYFATAMPLYERALSILDQTIGTDHPAVVAMINEMAMLYNSIGKKDKADQMLARIGDNSHGAMIK